MFIYILQYCEVTNNVGKFFYIGRPEIYKNKKLLFLFSKCLSLIHQLQVGERTLLNECMYCIFMLQFGGKLVQWRKSGT
jgi:hypothetical protein